MDQTAILKHLHEAGMIDGLAARVVPLSGGVSCDIFLVQSGAKKLVVKQALAKLRVKDDWYADVSRNRYEQKYMRYVAGFLPHAVPKVLHSDDERGYFAMEYMGDRYSNWKSLLMEGLADPDHARQAGRILGTIHRRSWLDEWVKSEFETTRNFFQLRADAYLLTTGRRHPPLQPLFEREADRLLGTRLCLVHGDYSPKNMLIGPDGRLVVLDCETAWFGDPAFDPAFLFNHFMLKALHHHTTPGPFIELARCAWDAYKAALDNDYLTTLDGQIARLQPMLMLARVDGKSPAEYLTDEKKKQLVRDFVTQWLSRPKPDLRTLWDAWEQDIKKLSNERHED